MSEQQANSPARLRAEARRRVRQLLTTTGPQRQQIAAELRRLGVWTRGSVRTRGSLSIPAENRLPEPDTLGGVVQALTDTDRALRCQVALALGEWGGEAAAVALQQVLQAETDAEVQLHCITALRTIGGPTAVAGLRWAAMHGTEAVRDTALTALEVLATGGALDDSEGVAIPARPTPAPPPARGSTRTRGAVRTRGGRSQEESASVVDSVTETLEQLRTDDTASVYLRQRAGAVLAQLRR